jgi:hypothetical protein
VLLFNRSRFARRPAFSRWPTRLTVAARLRRGVGCLLLSRMDSRTIGRSGRSRTPAHATATSRVSLRGPPRQHGSKAADWRGTAPAVCPAAALAARSRSPSFSCLPCSGLFNELRKPVIKGPKGPEPALGLFEKKPPDCPKKVWSPTSTCRDEQQSNKTTKVFAQRARGSRELFFVYVIIIITSTLRFRLRYVTVAGATASLP